MRALARPLVVPIESPSGDDLMKLALGGIATDVARALGQVLRAKQREKASASDVGHAMRDATPDLLEGAFKRQLFGSEADAHQRRIALLHLLTGIEAATLGSAAPKGAVAGPSASEPEMLTSEQAAKLLGVSRSHLNTLIDSNALPSSRTQGGHRRIARSAVLDYQVQMKTRQAKGLDDMTAASARLGLYADDLAGVPPRPRRRR